MANGKYKKRCASRPSRSVRMQLVRYTVVSVVGLSTAARERAKSALLSLSLLPSHHSPSAASAPFYLHDMRPFSFLLPTADTLAHPHECLPQLVLAPFALLSFGVVCIKPDSPLERTSSDGTKQQTGLLTMRSFGDASTSSLSPVARSMRVSRSFWPNLSQLPLSTTWSHPASQI